MRPDERMIVFSLKDVVEGEQSVIIAGGVINDQGIVVVVITALQIGYDRRRFVRRFVDESLRIRIHRGAFEFVAVDERVGI